MRAFLVLSLAALAGCGIFEPDPELVVGDLRPIEPLPSWGSVYGETASCVDEAAHFGRVDWFATGEIRRPASALDQGGAWLEPWGRPHGIAIHEDRLERGGVKLRATVRHEAIHEILQLGSHGGQVWCRCDGRDHLFGQCS